MEGRKITTFATFTFLQCLLFFTDTLHLWRTDTSKPDCHVIPKECLNAWRQGDSAGITVIAAVEDSDLEGLAFIRHCFPTL